MSNIKKALIASTLTISLICSMLAPSYVYPAIVNNGPYISCVTPDSAVITWQTDTNVTTTDNIVYYGLTSAYGSSQAAFKTETAVGTGRTCYIHSVKLSGLGSNTTYFYKVLSSTITDDNGGSGYYFKTFPPAGTANFKFAVIGDTRRGNESGVTSSNKWGDSLWAIRTLRGLYTTESEVPLVLNVGDVVASGQDFLYWNFANQLGADHTGTLIPTPSGNVGMFNRIFNSAPYKLLSQKWMPVAKGNHETMDGSDFYANVFENPYTGNGLGTSTDEKYYAFDYCNARIIVLNHGASNTDNRIGWAHTLVTAQYTWLESELVAARAANKWIIVMVHQAPFLPLLSSNKTNDGYMFFLDAYVLPLFQQYQVDLVFSGHAHIFWMAKNPLFIQGNVSGAPNGSPTPAVEERSSGTRYIVNGTNLKALHDFLSPVVGDDPRTLVCDDNGSDGETAPYDSSHTHKTKYYDLDVVTSGGGFTSPEIPVYNGVTAPSPTYVTVEINGDQCTVTCKGMYNNSWSVDNQNHAPQVFYQMTFSRTNTSKTISGYVKEGTTGINNVTVTLSGSSSNSYTTASDGFYSFSVSTGGNYTVTPAKTNYSFTPAYNSYSNLSADQTSQNFTGGYTGPVYSISGTVRDSSAIGINSVTMTVSGDTATVTTTDSSGIYNISNLRAGTFTLTPTKSAYTFVPSNKSYSLTSDQANQDFTGSVQSSSVTLVTGFESLTDLTANSGGVSTINLNTSNITQGNSSIKLDCTGGSYPGVSIDGTALSLKNWTNSYTAGMTWLMFDVYNPGSNVSFDYFIRNESLCRYNKYGNALENGWNTIRLDLTQATTLQSNWDIDTITLYLDASEVTLPVSLYFDNMRISNSSTTVQEAPPAYYSISGTIRDGNSAGISGVTVGLSGSGSESKTTDAVGAYSFGSLVSGNYTVTPVKTGYNFNPINIICTGISSNQANQNFTGTIIPGPVYSISGTVIDTNGTGLVNTAMVLSGSSSSGTISTDLNGEYTFSNLSGGSYTIVPAKTGWEFTPVQWAGILTDNLWIDFIGNSTAPIKYMISGAVKDANNTGLTGVLLTLVSNSGTSYKSTDSNGNFSFVNLINGNYTITPSKNGWTFDPAKRAYQDLTSTQAAQNFAGSLVVVEPVVQEEVPVGNMKLIDNKIDVKKETTTGVRVIYNISNAGKIRVNVYDTFGRLVKVITDEEKNAGKYEANWNGKDTNGVILPTGIYLIHITGPGINQTRKVCIVK
ncbi:MAG: hypothetical protein A2252_02225 [Elusimicrobia bacterium RIFOXYA2_FULL_39_19]|nr:MAG: hypothetical protein A2252_02225 [Elusimicrobia bacterium RIFOXYA2_FULL_39_19]